MNKYVRPAVVVMDGCAECVYSASGSAGTPGCDSKYMKGVYESYKGGWNKTVRSLYGCHGCPAYRAEGCGLLIDQAYIDGATSYDVDNGKRMPTWEAMGKTEGYMITDETGLLY